jgi:flagella basal body P-ring formation protein FlgA
MDACINRIVSSLLLCSSSVVLSQTHPHKEIQQAATEFVSQQLGNGASPSELEFIVTAPDKRLAVDRCTQALEPFWPYEPGNRKTVTVGVRCSGESQWKIFLQAELKRMRQVAVLNTPVRAGDVLDSSMTTTKRVNVLDLRSAPIDDVSGFLGMKFRRSLRSGTALAKNLLEIPPMVKRGEYIHILSGAGVVEVEARGYALSDGHMNETIKVRNTDSKKVIQALVVDRGYVRTSN